MAESDKEYLGDGVWVAVENGMIKLTTEEGYGPTNTIFLELPVFFELEEYVKKIKEKYKA